MQSTSSDEYPRCPSTLQRCCEQRENYVLRASVSLFELTATVAACWAGDEDVTALGFPVALAISRIGRLLHAVRRMRSKRAGRHFTKSGPTQAQPRQLVTAELPDFGPYWSVGLLPWLADMFRSPTGPHRRPFRS